MIQGRVVFRLGECINRGLEAIPAGTSRNEVLDQAATLIDKEIYRNYAFFPINYIAYDRMSGSDRFRNEYNGEEVAHFDAYLQRQVDKIDIPNKDSDFLRDKIIEMYGNTVKNHLEHRGKKSSK